MPDYSKLLESLEGAEQCLRTADSALVPLYKVTQIDAYILGLTQAARLILYDAKKAAKSAARKSKSKQI